ncbi:MAG: hypothetical protein ABJM06_04535 [Gilvibacter sp.]
MKHVLLFVPDGVGVRNYLYSAVLKNREAKFTLYHNFDSDTVTTLKNEVAIQQTLEIPTYQESVVEKFYRELIHCCRLKYNAKKLDNPTLLKNWNKKRSGLKNKLFYAFVNFVSNFYGSYKTILKLESVYQRKIRTNPLFKKVLAQLKNQQIDVLFCTHQRALKAPVIFAAAHSLGIKTAAVIYSWDNVPKARLALQADLYLSWSDHMKNELQLFYPEINPDTILVTGTPQFEFYHDPSLLKAREEFASEYNLDVNKKWLCFSGDDVYTSPQDPLYLQDIAQQLEVTGLQKDYQIVFRRCPVDVSGRYQEVINEFKETIIEIPPLWNFNTQQWNAIYPTKADIGLLVNVAYHCETVVNVGSTMAFDFGMFKKPAIYINYDQPNNGAWSVDTIYKYQHFRSMPSKDAVFWLNRKEDLLSLLQKIEQGEQTSIAAWFDTIVASPNSASDNIFNAIDL